MKSAFLITVGELESVAGNLAIVIQNLAAA
jgi:hypothetical protein